jgi:hypothetical protein
MPAQFCCTACRTDRRAFTAAKAALVHRLYRAGDGYLAMAASFGVGHGSRPIGSIAGVVSRGISVGALAPRREFQVRREFQSCRMIFRDPAPAGSKRALLIPAPDPSN